MKRMADRFTQNIVGRNGHFVLRILKIAMEPVIQMSNQVILLP